MAVAILMSYGRLVILRYQAGGQCRSRETPTAQTFLTYGLILRCSVSAFIMRANF